MATLIHSRVSPETLGFVRAYVFLIWLVKIVPDQTAFLAELPLSIFEPVGVLWLVPNFAWPWLLDPWFLQGFKGLLVALLLAAMIGVRPHRSIVVLCALLLTFHQGLIRSFTFVNHQEIAALLCVYALAVFPSVDGFAWPKRVRKLTSPVSRSAALVSMAALLVVPYAGIAAHRLASAAPAIFLSDSMAYWLASLSVLDSEGWTLGLRVLEHPVLLLFVRVGFPLVTCLEFLAPLCLVHERFRLIWLAVMAPFHVMTWFLMNILFWENLMLMVVLLVDIDRWVSTIVRWYRTRASHPSPDPATRVAPVG